jgi:3-dehydroquinate synthetase
VRRLAPLPRWPEVPVKTLMEAMRSDKKARRGNLRFVLTPRIGKAAPYDDVPVEAVERVLRFAPHFFCESDCHEPSTHPLRRRHG